MKTVLSAAIARVYYARTMVLQVLPKPITDSYSKLSGCIFALSSCYRKCYRCYQSSKVDAARENGADFLKNGGEIFQKVNAVLEKVDPPLEKVNSFLKNTE